MPGTDNTYGPLYTFTLVYWQYKLGASWVPYKAQHGAGIVAKYMLALVCSLLIQPSNDKKQLTPYGCPVAATNVYGLQLGVPIHTPTIKVSIAIIIVVGLYWLTPLVRTPT